MAVILDYAHSRTEASEAPEPTITVVADCDGFVIHGDGWPDGSIITPGLESEQPPYLLYPVDGVVDYVWPAWPGYGTYYWSVNGSLTSGADPTVVLSGTVECGLPI